MLQLTRKPAFTACHIRREEERLIESTPLRNPHAVPFERVHTFKMTALFDGGTAAGMVGMAVNGCLQSRDAQREPRWRHETVRPRFCIVRYTSGDHRSIPSRSLRTLEGKSEATSTQYTDTGRKTEGEVNYCAFYCAPSHECLIRKNCPYRSTKCAVNFDK